MAKRRKAKKSLMEELKATIHSLTRPKRIRKKPARRPSAAASAKAKTDSTLDMQKKLEKDLTEKMMQGMQKIKQEMEQELLGKVTNKKAAKTGSKEVRPEAKEAQTNTQTKSKPQKNPKGAAAEKSSAKPEKEQPKPRTDCTLLKLLTLSDGSDRRVVVGYEILDHGSQEIWGIDIHEGARLGRAKKIRHTKVKSRKVGPERQYYLVHEADDALYYSDDYAKAVLEQGRLTVGNYTIELADAIKDAYDSGYKNNSKRPKLH